MLQYDGVDYDLDSLFQYEMLKRLIEALAKNQKQMTQRIAQLEGKGGHSELKGSYYHHQHGSKERVETNSANDLSSSRLNESLNDKGDVNDFDSTSRVDAEGELLIEGEELTNKALFLRIIGLEKRVKEVPIVRRLLKAAEKKIDAQNSNLQSLSEKVEVNCLEIHDLQKELSDLRSGKGGMQMEVFDEGLGEEEGEGGEGNGTAEVDENKRLIKALEAKTVKKFGFIDDRVKSLQEEGRKAKEEQLALNKNIELLSSQLIRFNEAATEEDKKLSQAIESNASSFDSKLKEKITKICNELNILRQAKPSSSQATTIVQEQFTPKPSPNETDMSSQLFQRANKRINELERTVTSLKDAVSLDDSKESIAKLKESLNSKAERSELAGITSQLPVIDNKINELRDFTEALEKTVHNQGMDQKALFKKIEHITGTMLSMDIGTKDKKGPGEGKFVTLKTFNTQIASISKEIDTLVKENDSHHKHFSEMQVTLASVASMSDLSKLDKALRALLEEFKQSMLKKFSNKAEINKNIKLIEAQLKQLQIDITTRTEKSDTCMLASKQIGYKCASCEAELANYDHNRYNYLPWKQFSMRDFEVSYRNGNGFSRLVQKMSLDAKKTEDNNVMSLYESDEDSKGKRYCSEEKKTKRGNKLKKIKMNNLGRNHKVSVDVIDSKRINTSQILEQKVREPKPIRIYKKIKQVSIDENKKTAKNDSNYLSDHDMLTIR